MRSRAGAAGLCWLAPCLFAPTLFAPTLFAASGIEGAPFSAAEELATASLLRALEDKYANVTRWDVRPLGRSGREAMASHDRETQIRVLHVGSRSAVRLRSRDARGALSQTTLWYAVQGIRPVLLAERALAAGVPLDPADVAAAEHDVLAANCEPLDQAAPLATLRTKIAVRAGAVLCERSVEPRPPVAKGEIVTVHYSGRTVALTTNGVAQADGTLGRAVTIRNASSREAFRAVVSGPGEVTIHE